MPTIQLIRVDSDDVSTGIYTRHAGRLRPGNIEPTERIVPVYEPVSCTPARGWQVVDPRVGSPDCSIGRDLKYSTWATGGFCVRRIDGRVNTLIQQESVKRTAEILVVTSNGARGIDSHSLDSLCSHVGVATRVEMIDRGKDPIGE